MNEEQKTIIRISPSTLDAAQKCWRYFYFTRVLDLEPIEHNTRMDKGSFIHLLLENYYNLIKDGKSRLDAHKETIVIARDKGIQLDLDNKDTEEVIKTFTDYHNNYIHDSWVPLYVEQPFSTAIFENEKFVILLEGKIDLVAKVVPNENIIIVDHKSGEQNRDTGLLNNQFEGYCIAFDVQDVVRNFIGFQKDPTRRFSRGIKAYNSEVLEESRLMMVFWAFEIYDKVSSEESFYPINRKSCPYCEFASVCSRGPNDRKFILESNFQKRKEHDLFGRKDEK